MLQNIAVRLRGLPHQCAKEGIFCCGGSRGGGLLLAKTFIKHKPDQPASWCIAHDQAVSTYGGGGGILDGKLPSGKYSPHTFPMVVIQNAKFVTQNLGATIPPPPCRTIMVVTILQFNLQTCQGTINLGTHVPLAMERKAVLSRN